MENIPRCCVWRYWKCDKEHTRGISFAIPLQSSAKISPLYLLVKNRFPVGWYIRNQRTILLVFKYLLLLVLLLLVISRGKASPVNLPPDAPSYLRLELGKDAVNTENIIVHFLKSASAKYEYNSDAPYFKGFGQVSLSSFSSDGMRLAINVLPYPKKSEPIGLMVDVTSSGAYKLYLKNISNVPRLFDVWLMDAFKKDSLDLRNNKSYNFNIDKTDSSTFGSRRFTLVIRRNPLYACKLTDFQAKKISDSAKTARLVQLNWETVNEQNYTSFTIERSIDNGNSFDGLGDIPSSGAGAYSLVDKNPSPNGNIYRLKLRDISDSTSYSNTVSVSYTDASEKRSKNNLSVYPNPAGTTISLHVAVPDTVASLYTITITNSSGLLVKQVISPDAAWQGSVADLMPGIYMIRVSNNKSKLLVGSAKFLKM